MIVTRDMGGLRLLCPLHECVHTERCNAQRVPWWAVGGPHSGAKDKLKYSQVLLKAYLSISEVKLEDRLRKPRGAMNKTRKSESEEDRFAPNGS